MESDVTRKLLDSSNNDSNTSDIQSNDEKIENNKSNLTNLTLNEINEVTSKKSKFQVIKRNEDVLAIPLTTVSAEPKRNSSKESEPDTNNNLNIDNDVLFSASETSFAINEEKISLNQSEINEDVFDELEDLPETNLQTNNNRYAEGQDTITSLKNSVFLQQLAIIKRKASVKSNKANANKTVAENASLTTPQLNQRAVLSISNLFKSQESINSKRSSAKFFGRMSSVESKGANSNSQAVSLNITNDIDQDMASAKLKPTKQLMKQVNESITNIQEQFGVNPDIFIETVSEIIINNNMDADTSAIYLKQLQLIMQLSENSKKRRKAIYKFLSFMLICLLIILTFIMSLIVVVCVFLNLEKIDGQNSNRTYISPFIFWFNENLLRLPKNATFSNTFKLDNP